MDDDGIREAASYMPVFPIVGALLGLMAGVFVWALGFILPVTVVGMLGVGFILFLNGVQHTDGLLDFGDGLMCHGSRERKLRVMRDPQTGAGGLCLGVVVIFGSAMSIAGLERSSVVQSLVVSEAAAKFSMVFEAWAGKSAHKGMNTMFVGAMHGKHGHSKMVAALITLLLISSLSLRQIGPVVTLVSILVSMILILVAVRNFGGLTGDVMGATNEITRLFSLLTILGVSHWL
jgi:adenosylcobinamide-GDP ribazoletransferase